MNTQHPLTTLKRIVATLLISAAVLNSGVAQAYGGGHYRGGHHGHHHHRHHGGSQWWGPALGVGLVLGSAAIIAHNYSPPPPRAPAVYPPQNNLWYFCADYNAYYPQVPTCPSGWRVVPASAPPGY